MQSLKRSGPLNVRTIEQSLKRNGPLDAQVIEMRLVGVEEGGGGGGGGGERRCCLDLARYKMRSWVRSRWGDNLFRPPLKAPSDPEKERTSRRARYRADPEKRQRYCHSPERASRSAKRVKVTQRYVVPLQPPSHIKMDYFTCYTAHNRV